MLYLAANGDPAASSERPRWDLESNTVAFVNTARAVPGRSRRLPVVGRGLRRAARRRDAGDAGRRRSCRTRSRSWPPSSTCGSSAEHRGTVSSYVNVRFFGAYGPYEAPRKITTRWLQALARGEREFVDRGRRPEPDRLHVCRRCGRRVSGAGQGDGRELTVDFASGAPVSVNDVVPAMAQRSASTSRFATKARCPSTSSSARRIRTMRDRFGVAPSIAFDDGLERLRAFLAARTASAETAGNERKAASRGAGRGPGRHLGGVAPDEARLSGHGARTRRRRRRHGPHDQASATTRSISGRTRSTSARPPRARRSSKTITPFFGEDPLTLVARHARAAARQGVRLPARDAAGAVRRQPAAVGADPVRLFGRDDQVDVRAGEERGLVRRLGRQEPRPHALRPVLRHLLGARVGLADQPDFVEAGAARRQAESEEHHPAHARHQGGSDDVFHEVLLSARRASASCTRAWRRKCGPRGNQRAAQLAGGSRRARRRPACARVVYTTDGGEQSIECDVVLSTLPLPALVNMMSPALPPAGDRPRRAAALSQPEADLHRAEAPAAHRLSLGLSARRAVPRQPHVGAEERQPRHGAEGSHHPLHRAVAVEGRAAVAGQRRGDLPAGARAT